LAISGAHLIITARNEKRGNRCVVELIEETKNPNIEYLYMDLCDLKSVEAAAEKIQRDVPHLDVLLNCAGLGYIDSWMMTNDGNEVMYSLWCC
jgi:short-subunit dehydrogenase